jgi:hypothetical protein
MSRRALIVAVLLPLWGCSTRPPATVTQALKPSEAEVASALADSEESEPAPAAKQRVVATALVFDLPEATFGPPLDLRRGGRQPVALLGYDEGVSEFYSVWTDDRQRENVNFDRYERRAVSVRSGARYR